MSNDTASQGSDSGLLPCPFCGDRASRNFADDNLIGCANHHCAASDAPFTRAAWNRRASVAVSRPEPDTIDLMAALKRSLNADLLEALSQGATALASIVNERQGTDIPTGSLTRYANTLRNAEAQLRQALRPEPSHEPDGAA